MNSETYLLYRLLQGQKISSNFDLHILFDEAIIPTKYYFSNLILI